LLKQPLQISLNREIGDSYGKWSKAAEKALGSVPGDGL